MIIYFVIFASVNWPKWIIAAIAFSINSGAYVSEIIRAGILSIDKGQTEAGRSLGLSKAQTMMSIVIPQAIKNIFPAMRVYSDKKVLDILGEIKCADEKSKGVGGAKITNGDILKQLVAFILE